MSKLVPSVLVVVLFFGWLTLVVLEFRRIIDGASGCSWIFLC